MARPSFTIQPSHRAAIVGRTGSGKSTLARVLAGAYRSLVVIDPKHGVELPGTVTVHTPAEFRRLWPQKARRVIVRPDPVEVWDHADEVIRRVMAYGRTALLVDEAVDLAPSSRIVPAYKRALVQGRSLSLPVISCSQRPRDLYNTVLSESEHLFVFDLQLDTDRRKMAGVMGDGVTARLERPFTFYYYGPDTGGRVVLCDPVPIEADPAARATPPTPNPGG